jgi:hypothetical protein
MKITGLGTLSVALGVAVLALGTPLVGTASDSVFTIPTAQLLTDSEFGARAWGPGTVASRTAASGGAVDFAFTGLGTSGTGVKDDYAVDAVYGQILPSHGNGDFSNFTGYGLRFENLDDAAVWVQLCINTGFTGASGTPSSDPTNNTFWASYPGWRELGPGEDLLVILDFDGATAYQISDNKVPHTGGGLGWPDGGVYVVNPYDRSELSAIGFEVADFAGTNPNAVIRLTPVAADAGVAILTPAGWAVSAFPNPGRAVTVRVAAEAGTDLGAAPATLAIYDVRGRLVRPLWTGVLAGGGIDLPWDGADAGGIRCAPGFYLVRLSAGRASCTRTVMLLD